ncbi:MAG: hypothetical protein GX087_12095 [Desulfobulbaceae bacterium]|nr:hypothetical protein [Desulfobulbaceae bacterium]
MNPNTRPVCPSCGGSGEIAFFGGESRFLLTREECPLCSGLGYILDEDISDDKTKIAPPETKKKA